MKEETLQNQVSIFPNPFKDFLIVNLTGSKEGMYKATLMDIVGRKVWESPITSVSNKIFIQQNLPEGIYLLEIRLDNNLLRTYKVMRSN